MEHSTPNTLTDHASSEGVADGLSLDVLGELSVATGEITQAVDAGHGLPEAPLGFRWTKQRREVYQMLLDVRNHPTATEVFMRSKAHIPGISLATVYNCLETLTQAGLVKQVNFERSPSRYCPNLHEHAHFYDERTGEVRDVELREGVDLCQIFKLPEGVRITRAEISLKGELAPAPCPQNAEANA